MLYEEQLRYQLEDEFQPLQMQSMEEKKAREGGTRDVYLQLMNDAAAAEMELLVDETIDCVCLLVLYRAEVGE